MSLVKKSLNIAAVQLQLTMLVTDASIKRKQPEVYKNLFNKKVKLDVNT